MKNRTSKNSEDFLRNSLKDLKVNPRRELWTRVSNSFDETASDLKLNSKLIAFKEQPPLSTQESVHKKIGNIKLMNSRLVKAASICLLISFFFTIEYPYKKWEVLFSSDYETLSSNDYNLCKNPTLHLLDSSMPPLVSNTKKTKINKAYKTKMLLDLILAEEEGVLSAQDSTTLLELLKPIGKLSDESMLAAKDGIYLESRSFRQHEFYSLPELKFSVSIPLKILDENDKLLKN